VTSEPEFSRPVAVDQVGERGRTVDIAANPEERAGLARRFGLVRLDRLEATGRLSRSSVFYRLELDWVADVVQSCVVTLEPVAEHLSDHLDERYGLTEQDAELDLDPEADAPEPIEAGIIDVGEAVAQALSLSLDPYPRKPGATLEVPGSEEGGQGPFAALAKLKRGS
jgi:uncharacterized metal-binding protein YceD (DUF177 family)